MSFPNILIPHEPDTPEELIHILDEVLEGQCWAQPISDSTGEWLYVNFENGKSFCIRVEPTEVKEEYHR